MGDACPRCKGVGTVRIKGRPGDEREACSKCGGSGMTGPLARRKS